MMRSIFGAAIGLCLIGMGAAHAAGIAPDVPANTIPCQDFVKNFDSSWTAYSNTPAFDIGNVKNYTLEAATVSPGSLIVDGVDLWEVINKQCGGDQSNFGQSDFGHNN
jgi:hypothetical protein